MAIQRRGSHPAAPLFALARPVFAWQATDRTGARDGFGPWALGSAPVEASSPYGRALSFTGNTTTGLTRAGVSTAAQTRFWFAALFRWRLNAMGGGSFPQLLGTSNTNTGWRVGGNYTSGNTISLGIVKGGVATLSAVAAVDNVWYQAVGANRQDTGEHYLILKPLDVPGDWLRTATADTSASVGGSGSAGIGIARTDFAGAWSGDIVYCAAGFDWLPENVARQWLTAPRTNITRRRLWAPLAAGSNISLTLSGQSVAAVAGNLGLAMALPLTGQSAAISAGTLSLNVTIALIGSSVAASAGTITYSASNNVTLTLSGASVSALAGSLAPSVTLPISGAAVTVSSGTVTYSGTGATTITVRAGSWIRYKAV